MKALKKDEGKGAKEEIIGRKNKVTKYIKKMVDPVELREVLITVYTLLFLRSPTIQFFINVQFTI